MDDDSAGRSCAVGRCLFRLPNDGGHYSWSRRRGRAALVYGHLLNRLELQQRLGGWPAATLTDAELLLAAYERWGSDVARELEGSYVAVIWDEADEELLCIRDAIGTMPAFYARAGSALVLSSDIWTVLQDPQVSREVNRLAVAEHMLWRHTQVEETFFTRVRRLPGAHILQACGTDISVRRYWDPCPSPGEPVEWVTPTELERFPELMRRTAASTLALGPAALSLSSGIDSVSVAAFAMEAAEEQGWPRPHGLAVHFDDPRWDESPGQRAAADALGMPCHFLSASECLGKRPLLEAMLELSPSYPSPLPNTWEPILVRLTEVARAQGLRVILTGIGGDEWLSVSPLLAADLIQAGNLVGLWRLYQAHRRSYHCPDAHLARYMLWSMGLKPVLHDVISRFFPTQMARRRRPLVLPNWVAPDPQLRRALEERLQPLLSPPPREARYLRALRPMLQQPHTVMLMESMYYRCRGRGVSYFHPYWSRPVVDFLLRTPPHLLNGGGRSKGFVRGLLAERLPQLDLHRQKKVTANPFFREAVLAQWPGLWRRWERDSALARAGVADATLMEGAMKEEVAGGRWHPIVWLSSEAWLRDQEQRSHRVESNSS